MKRRIFTTLDNLAKRDIFDAKYAQLEKRRENLDKQISRYADLERSLIDEVITGKRAV